MDMIWMDDGWVGAGAYAVDTDLGDHRLDAVALPLPEEGDGQRDEQQPRGALPRRAPDHERQKVGEVRDARVGRLAQVGDLATAEDAAEQHADTVGRDERRELRRRPCDHKQSVRVSQS